MRRKRLASWAIGVLCMVSAWPARAQSPDGYTTASFRTRCARCWPGWVELARPLRGVGPSVQNGLAFLFTNGSFADPLLNRSHLLFDQVEGPLREVFGEFQFNNAAIGGRLLLSDGPLLCLPPSYAIAYVTEELFILTLRDDGERWYGAFIGDFTLLDPTFVPNPEWDPQPSNRSAGAPAAATPYTTVGLLEKTEHELVVHALEVIPQVTRFSRIRVRAMLEEDLPSPRFRAIFHFADGRTVEVQSELDLTTVRPEGRAGVLYLVGNGSPCTSLVQREVALRTFSTR